MPAIVAGVPAPERQFDFWVGEWDVFDPAGRHVGRSRIELINGGRVVFENWMSDRGVDGKSMNFYDAQTGRWHQVWVDEDGGVLRLDGDLVDGAICYAGETPLPDGGRQQERLSFTPLDDGRVRQFWQQSADRGATWTVAFDGLYVRRGAGDEPRT